MYKNFKIVCNSAAGRRRYMQYLVPSILSSDIIDRYDIWVNTTDMCDIEFFKRLSDKYPKVNLVWQPDGIIDGVKSINAFYRNCIEDNTIYLRLDDDVIWVEPDFFEKIVKFRIEHPEYLCVSPLVINNPKSTYILQVKDKLHLNNYYNSETFHDVFWKDGNFAYQLHSWFLNNYLKNDSYSNLFCGEVPIGVTRFSINSICWFGSDLKKINGIVDGDEEEFMSCVLPTRLGMPCCYYCDTIIAHFAFFTQRAMLDKMDILQKYGNVMHEKWKKSPVMSALDNDVQKIMEDIENNSEKISNGECPYKTSPVQNKKYINKVKSTVKRLTPLIILEHIHNSKYSIEKFIQD